MLGTVGPKSILCVRLHQYKYHLISLLNEPRFLAGNCGSRMKNEQHMFGSASVCLIYTVLLRCINEQKCCLHT